MATKHTHIIEAKTKGTKKAESSVKSLKKSIVGLSAAYIGASGLIAGIKGSITAYSEQERVEKKLKAALGSSTDALLKQASALQGITIFGDEAVIAQQAFLASIGMTEQQIMKILPVAADLSAATGITLESAVRNTAKTFSGLAGELGELVPQLRDLTEEEMKAGEAVEVMADLFKNQASAEAKTLSGRLSRVKNVMGDIAEDIGESLAPALDDLAFAFLNAMGEVEETEAIEKQIDVQKRLLERYEALNGTVHKQSILHSDGKTITQDYTKAIESSKNKIIELENQLLDIQTKKDEQAEKEKKNNKDSIETEEKSIATLKEKMTLSLKQLTFEQDAAKITQGIGKTAIKLGNMNAMEEWQTSMVMAVVNAASAIIKASSKGGLKGGLLMTAQMAPQVATIAANKPKAQTGFEGVVDEPTQFTVGEGGAAEYVSVTPMEGVNNAGGGAGININITGNVMSEQFVEEELAERISEAVRRGVNFGMS